MTATGPLPVAYPRPPRGPASLFESLWQHRRLIVQLVRRDVLGRYRGSMVGLAWSFLYPLLMLLVYTFVFSVVFESRWPGALAGESKARFALLLFVGVLCHGFLSEVLLKAPTTVVGNANYVKRVVFPLETLGFTLVGSAAFHMLVGLMILLAVKLATEGSVPLSVLWLPLVLAPLACVGLGIAWLFAALGVFVRDIGQIAGVLATLLMFLAPVFYPVAALPVKLQAWMSVNPITVPIEQARRVLFAGQAPEPGPMMLYWGVALMLMLAGYTVFQSLRRGFADVL
ncbi:MAG: ABC transporter permease [Xanthomonadales bacterium]|nr:ABC transporter permease [Xanthomonadales bacterium]